MECTTLRIDYEKTTQAVNYIACRNGGKINKLKAIKLLFFADRYHLRKFGRPVTNDNYVAMDMGPVGSGAKDIIDQTVYLSKRAKIYASEFLEKQNNLVLSRRKIEENIFSSSDIEALNFAWSEFGKYDVWKLKDITHKYPEWKKHKPTLDAGVLSVPMNYIDFFDDPNPRYNSCHELTEKEKKYGRELLMELFQVENAWN